MKIIFDKLNRFFCGSWSLGVLKVGSGLWTIEPQNSNLSYLKAVNANGHHIFIQPLKQVEPFYLLIDDLSWDLIGNHHQYNNEKWKPGRLIVETSPDNYQVWLHSSRPIILDEKRFWLKKLCNDPGADPNRRWGRCPGFRNRKSKYRDSKGGYPLSKLIWIDWKNQVTIPQTNLSTNQLKKNTYYNICRLNYDRGNESATDFSYALALIRRGYQDNEIQSRILRERVNWENHKGQKRMRHYLNSTLKNARILAERT